MAHKPKTILLTDHHFGLCRGHSAGKPAAHAALLHPGRPGRGLLRRPVYRSLRRLRNRSGGAGHRHLLERLWPGRASADDSDRRDGGNYLCCGAIHRRGPADFSPAAGHHAGGHLRSEAGGHCPADRLYYHRHRRPGAAGSRRPGPCVLPKARPP